MKVKIIRILKIIIGAAGYVWCLIPVIFSGILNAGNGAGLLFFGVLFLWGVFQDKLNKTALNKKWVKILRGVLIGGYCAFTLLFAVESVLLINACNTSPAEGATVVVLGCGVRGTEPSQMLRLRLDAAEEYLKEHPEAKAVLSGGQGPGEDITEALCMQNELIERGIDAERLYMEDRSTNTRENIAFSAQIIKENNLSENLAVVSNNFHLYRASLSVKQEGMNFGAVPAFTPYPLLLTYVLREYLGIAAQWALS